MPVNVIYGADEDEFGSLVGETFNNAIDAVRDVMGIPDSVTNISLNNDDSPKSGTILKDGDTIVFYKSGGVKGN